MSYTKACSVLSDTLFSLHMSYQDKHLCLVSKTDNVVTPK